VEELERLGGIVGFASGEFGTVGDGDGGGGEIVDERVGERAGGVPGGVDTVPLSARLRVARGVGVDGRRTSVTLQE